LPLNSHNLDKKSPMVITEKGYELVNRLGIYEMIALNWNKISDYIDRGVTSFHPYDIDRFIIEHIVVYPLNFIQAAELNKIKLLAYTEGLPLINYLTVIAILIREKYFETKGIDVSDVDKNA